MKKLLFLMMTVFILTAGCKKDNPSPVLGQNELKEKMVTRAMTVTFVSIPDFSLPHVECLPENSYVFLCGGGSVQGNASETGDIVTKESLWRVNSCETGSVQDEVKEYISGRITAVSGNYFTYSGTIIVNVVDNTLTGALYIEGGTGKYHRSSGMVNIEGLVNVTTGRCSWTGTGSISLWM